MNYISSILFISFFVFFPIYILTGIKILDLSFIILTIYTIAGFLFFSISIKRNVLIFLLIVIVYLLISVVVGYYYNTNVLVTLKQLLYYLKPVLFFMFGYLFLNIRLYRRCINYILTISFIGFFCFLFFENEIIKYTMTYLDIKEVGYFYSFGSMVRNMSFFISPLEFGGLCFYLFFFYLTGSEFSKKYQYLILALILMMIFFTLSRTIWIITILTFMLYYSLNATTNNKIYHRYILLLFTIIAFFVLFLLNQSFFNQYFIKDGSSSVHHSNLIDTLSYIFTYPLGTGLGSSGWAGYDANLSFYKYSEGSFFANCIELGFIQYCVILIIMVKFTLKLDKNLFSIFVGYIIGCMIIPLGFSTFINLLLFSYFGILSRKKNVF